jgi:ribosomal protein S18 acetylase RimI-like enzyme
VHIRQARPSDAGELLRLNELFNGPDLSGADGIAAALAENPDELVFVAEEGETLSGFICGRVYRSFCYREKNAEITELFVEARTRHGGVGTALISHMEARLRALGADEIHLYTGKDNRAAQAFYERAGYLPSPEIEYHKRPQGGR